MIVTPSDTYTQAVVQRWIETFVVEMNLCPFARREMERATVRIAVSDSFDEASLLGDLDQELDRLHREADTETTLLVHPQALQGFTEYNEFLGFVDDLIEARDEEGIFQVASFHPDYVFDGTSPGDAANFTNRSPYPMLHILREGSVAQAVASYAGIEDVPARNIAYLESIGTDKLQGRWEKCFEDGTDSDQC